MEDDSLRHTDTDSDAGDRSPGPFGHPEGAPPKPVLTWINKIHPTTKKPQILLNFNWQTAPALRILASFLMHTSDWTTKTVTRREVLDKSDKNDSAKSLFVLDSWGDPLIRQGEILRALRQAANVGDDAAALQVAATALSTRQQGRITTWVADANNPVVETDRLKYTIFCEFTEGELGIYKEYVRVYDAALCHFFPDICELQVRRYLHAERIKAANANTPVTLKWAKYKSLYLQRLKNDTKSTDLLKFVLTPREDGLEITLWVAERRSERSLLEKDGTTMAEATWLSFVTNFITNDERMALKIPADQEMASYDGGNGYLLSTLETALADLDTSTLKRFRQGSVLSNALAKRVVELAKFSPASSEKPINTKKKEISANEKKKPPAKKTFVPVEGKTLTGAALKALDTKASLPTKNGSPDPDTYKLYKEHSLRRKLWDRLVAAQCVRCGDANHKRSDCPRPRAGFEDDFDKGLPFWKLQHRPQWTVLEEVEDAVGSPPFPSSSSCTLAVMTAAGLAGIDTFSDISTAYEPRLLNLRPCSTLSVQHLGGSTSFRLEGELLIGTSNGNAVHVTCFAASKAQLPDDMTAILGMPAIASLGLSLDFILHNPLCLWNSASSLPSVPADYDGSTIDPEPEAAVLQPTDETSTLDVSVQPSWLARLLLLCAFCLLTALPLRLPHRDALLGTSNNGHSIFDEPPYAVRTEIWWGPPPTTTAPDICDATSVRQPYCDDPPISTVPGKGPSYCNPPSPFVNQTKALEFFRPLQLLCYPQLSSSAFTGGKALRASTTVLPAGCSEPVEIIAGVDTMSDVSLALRHLLTDVEAVMPDDVRGTGSITAFSEQGYLDIFDDGRVQRVPAFVATTSNLPTNCQVLLGIPAILDLGVVLDEQKLKQNAPLVCHLGEKTLRAWIDSHPDESVDTKPFDINSIDVCPDLPPHVQARIRAIIEKHAACFEGQSGTLPKPFDAPPVELTFLPDAEPKSIPEPRWSFAYREVILRWAEAGLKNGSLEPSKSAWASRAHVVLKPPSGATAATADIKDCKLRVTGDYRQVNTQIQKLVPNLPTGTHELERAAGHRFYFESDSVACYNSFILAKGISREALAIWSPIGLVQPTVLPFGQKNSGTEAQGPYRNAARSLKNLANYMDDWLGFTNNVDQLCIDFEKFLAVCVANNITLNTTKTRVGYSSAQFFGFTVSADGTRLSDKHLDPLQNLVPPTDIPELRRVLGLFVVSRRFIKDYAMVVKPMTDILRGRHPEFSWSQPQQDAFDTVRELLLGGIHLSPPDYSLPFHLATDASEDGKGGYLYQLPSIPIEDQHPFCPRKHGPDNVAIIQFLSKSWTETQRNRPPFYLEADALLWAQEKCKFYALSSPFPFYTYSDHLPLMWMQKSEKGPVSKFIIENLSELTTIHQYICGPQNSIPDAASRYPMLGPKRLAPTGLAHAVQELLSRLPAEMKAAKIVHAHAGSDTADVRRIIQSWRNASGSVLAVSPPRDGSPTPADLAIMIPRVEAAPVALASYLLSTTPFALLLPIDLASQAYSPGLYFGSPHEEIEAAFQKAGKLSLLSPQMIWIIGNVPDCAPVETFSAELRTPAPLMDLFALATTPNTAAADPNTSDPGSPSSVDDDSFVTDVPQTLEAWAEAQAADPEFGALIATINDVAVRSNLHIHAPADRPPRIIVPPSTQTALIRHTHVRMWHLGSDKVSRTLRLSYYWPTLTSDTRRVLRDCPGCELEKARQTKAHGLFSARPYETPRTRWAMDFQGQGTSSDGMCQALGLIDTTSRFVVVIPLPNREATTLIQPYLDRVVYTHGPPVTLHSDAAPEFLDRLVQLAADATDTHTTNTLGHNAQGNAAIEIFWRFWNRCMRILPDDLYLQWPSFTSRIVYAYNSAPHTSLGGISPFEIMHGVPARSPFDVAVQAAILDAVLPTADLADPQAFADTIKVSVAAFTAHARHHSDYVRSTTADRLNTHGHATTYEVGDRVKIRVPPSHEQMLSTGRRSSHITAWRGPCTVTARLSTTGYSMTEDSSDRRFERTILNMLPYRATSAVASNIYDPFYSDPFTIDEIIAVRDDPESPFYIAKATAINATFISVQYYGCKTRDTRRAVFRAGWHHPGSNDITIAVAPLPNQVPYTGRIELDSLRELLVARNLAFTAASRLRRKSQLAIAPHIADLFIF